MPVVMEPSEFVQFVEGANQLKFGLADQATLIVACPGESELIGGVTVS